MINSISQRERYFSSLDVDQLSTLEVLCPRAQWVPTGKLNCSSNLESALGESLKHCGIKLSVLFTQRTGSTMNVNLEVIVTDTKRAILSVSKAAATAR